MAVTISRAVILALLSQQSISSYFREETKPFSKSVLCVPLTALLLICSNVDRHGQVHCVVSVWIWLSSYWIVRGSISPFQMNLSGQWGSRVWFSLLDAGIVHILRDLSFSPPEKAVMNPCPLALNFKSHPDLILRPILHINLVVSQT